jgi:hypothetical protein
LFADDDNDKGTSRHTQHQPMELIFGDLLLFSNNDKKQQADTTQPLPFLAFVFLANDGHIRCRRGQ